MRISRRVEGFSGLSGTRSRRPGKVGWKRLWGSFASPDPVPFAGQEEFGVLFMHVDLLIEVADLSSKEHPPSQRVPEPVMPPGNPIRDQSNGVQHGKRLALG
jgi:hypothetical protein